MFTIHVSEFLEMFTTIYGWTLYMMFYDLLSMIGVLYFPFLLMLYKIWSSTTDSADAGVAAVAGQRQLHYSVISMVLVYMLCVLPVINLNVNNVNYSKTCQSPANGPVTVNANAAQPSVYGNNLLPANAQGLPGIPVFWWVVMAFSGGVNQAVTSSIPCLNDIRNLDKTLRSLDIKDPTLKEEYQRFANECFLPAKARFIGALKGSYGPVFQQHTQLAYDAFLQGGGNEKDPYYIGSRFYQETPGYYEWQNLTPANCTTAAPGGMCSLRAEKPVYGWPYLEIRDNYNAADIAAGTPGRPYCDEWWNGANQQLALRRDLADSAQATESKDMRLWNNATRTTAENVLATLENGWANIVYDRDEMDEMVIKRLVAANEPDMDNSDTVTNLQAAGVVGTVGVAALSTTAAPVIASGMLLTGKEFAKSMANFYTTMWVIKQVAPKAQAIILMVIYALMIFYLVMSNYEVENIITMMFIILAIKFWTALWVIADYLDEALFAAMYFNDQDGTFSAARFLDNIAAWATMGTDRLFLDMVLTVLYVLMPMLLLTIMGIAGVNAGKLAQGMDDFARHTGKFGNVGSGAIGKIGPGKK